eukprot:COSAG01_NODE_2803_length_7047_cov_19.196891_13_plen_141_part_00
MRRLPDEEEADPLIGMCVRVNSLDFAARQVADFALQLEGALGIAPGEFLHGAQNHAVLLGACSTQHCMCWDRPRARRGCIGLSLFVVDAQNACLVVVAGTHRLGRRTRMVITGNKRPFAGSLEVVTECRDKALDCAACVT